MDVLFFEVFRNVYIRKIISDIFYVEYIINVNDKLESFRQKIIKECDNNGVGHCYNYRDDISFKYSLYVNDLILHSGVLIEEYNGSMILYLESINYFLCNNYKDNSVSKLYACIKYMYNKSYVNTRKDDKDGIINLFLMYMGERIHSIIPMYTKSLSYYNKTYITRDIYLTKLYTKMEKDYSYALCNMLYEKSYKYVNLFHIFKDIFSSVEELLSKVYIRNLYKLYIRYLYVAMLHIKDNNNIILFNTRSNAENTLYSIFEYINISKDNYYKYIDDYTIETTSSYKSIIKGIINSNIDYESIYKDVCVFIEEELSQE